MQGWAKSGSIKVIGSSFHSVKAQSGAFRIRECFIQCNDKGEEVQPFMLLGVNRSIHLDIMAGDTN